MKRKDCEKWERMKAGGKKHFLIKHGILGWGLPLGILFPLINAFIQILGNSSVSFSYFLSFEFLITLIFSLFVFAIGGLLYGILFWKLAENSCRKYREKRDN